ncbi:hypothetical protein DFH29DRAFT_570524 [Suillus ampliporus]|nr:hypothetical protein DFH29DRAFT_570524 [Suillus ampliporus]
MRRVNLDVSFLGLSVHRNSEFLTKGTSDGRHDPHFCRATVDAVPRAVPLSCLNSCKIVVVRVSRPPTQPKKSTGTASRRYCRHMPPCMLGRPNTALETLTRGVRPAWSQKANLSESAQKWACVNSSELLHYLFAGRHVSSISPPPSRASSAHCRACEYQEVGDSRRSPFIAFLSRLFLPIGNCYFYIAVTNGFYSNCYVLSKLGWSKRSSKKEEEKSCPDRTEKTSRRP